MLKLKSEDQTRLQKVAKTKEHRTSKEDIKKEEEQYVNL